MRTEAKFSIGQLIQHRLFDYRGVVVDVDPIFLGDDKWYDEVARSRPPKDKPWYHVLVDNAAHTTYVAERNLDADESLQPIQHPAVAQYFEDFKDGAYITRLQSN